MNDNKIDSFNIIAKEIFQILIDQYGYILEDIKISEKKWSTHHIYVNNSKNLKIIIKQEPYYTDYGFSFFIFKIGTEEYNILYNVPHEKQDTENNFLRVAYEKLFSNDETLDLINGENWKELKKIPFKL